MTICFSDKTDSPSLPTIVTSYGMVPQQTSAATSSRSRRWRRKPLHTVVAIVLCATTFHMILSSWDDDDTISSPSSSLSLLDDLDNKRRQLAYFDTIQMKPIPYGRRLIDPNFQSLIHPTDIDGKMFKKQTPQEFEEAAADAGGEESSTNKKWSACQDILLFMPYPFAHNGHGSQLNSFILAGLVATYTNRAMVILEPPNQVNAFKSNSQFGCPTEAWMTEVRRTGAEPVKIGWNEDFPVGLTRLIRHPSWLSRGCSVPCIDQYTYEEWDALRTKDIENALEPHQIICDSNISSDDGDDEASTTTTKVTTNVVVMGGDEVRQFFVTQYKDQMLDRSTIQATTQAYDWSVRLGAKPHEARIFSNTTLDFDYRDKWDYVSALLARSGILRFQPWIGRDVEDFMKQYVPDLNLNEEYDAIHVRRGDKVYAEGKRHVRYYWQQQGQYDEETGAMPRDYIPFIQYLIQFENVTKCLDGPRTVYVSTDDPAEVKSEIHDMPKDEEGYTLLMTNSGEVTCHRFRFIFTTYDQELLSKDGLIEDDNDKKAYTGMTGSSPFHLQDDPAKRSCEDRYERNIASIADLMLLAKSNVAVVEYNSNWGRLVRLFRLRLNDTPRILNGARPVVQKGELKIAWGKKLPGPPGF